MLMKAPSTLADDTFFQFCVVCVSLALSMLSFLALFAALLVRALFACFSVCLYFPITLKALTNVNNP